jgi:hypothetical protein
MFHKFNEFWCQIPSSERYWTVILLSGLLSIQRMNTSEAENCYRKWLSVLSAASVVTKIANIPLFVRMKIASLCERVSKPALYLIEYLHHSFCVDIQKSASFCNSYNRLCLFPHFSCSCKAASRGNCKIDCLLRVWVSDMCLSIWYVPECLLCVWVSVVCLSVCYVSECLLCVCVFAMCLSVCCVSECLLCVWVSAVCLSVCCVSACLLCVWVSPVCLSVCYVSECLLCVWVFAMCLSVCCVSECMLCVWVSAVCLSVCYVSP